MTDVASLLALGLPLGKRVLLAGLVVCCGLTSFVGAQAQPVEAFYRDRQINLIVGGTPGAGYDLYARVMAPYLAKHIPGQPKIIVQNMVGASGIKAANYLYSIAPQDGSVIGMLQSNNPFFRFFDPSNKGVEYEAQKFHWLGSPQQEVGLFIMTTKTGLRSVEDIRKREFTVSSSTRNSPSTIYAHVLNATFGSKLKVITGYAGTPAALLAVERGEVEGHLASASSSAWRSRIAPWIEKGDAKLIMQLASARDAAYPDVPTAIELADSALNKEILQIVLAPQITGRPFLAPPGVPADRVRALRAAFELTMRDPEFLSVAKAKSFEINPVNGEQIDALIQKVFATPPELATRIRELTQ